MLERIFFTKILNQEYFFVYDLSYDLQTYIKQSASLWQLLISFKWKINLMYFKINILFHTSISETISNSNVTMATASLSTIELNSFNNAIFSAINRIRHIKKTCRYQPGFKWNKKPQEFEDITRKYLQNYLNKLITEKKIINKINRDQHSNTVNRDILKIHELDQTPSPVSPTNSSFDNSLFSILPPLIIEIPFSSCQD